MNVYIILPARSAGARHIAAVEHLILSETKPDCIEKDNKEVIIGKPVRECPQCHGKKFVYNGWHTGRGRNNVSDKIDAISRSQRPLLIRNNSPTPTGRSGKKQRYKCQECNRRFRDNLGFEHRHTSYMFITLCQLLHETGMPAVRLPHILSYMGITVSTNTITRWPEHYTDMVEKYTDSIRPPNPGNRLSAGEKRQDIGGRERDIWSWQWT